MWGHNLLAAPLRVPHAGPRGTQHQTGGTLQQDCGICWASDDQVVVWMCPIIKHVLGVTTLPRRTSAVTTSDTVVLVTLPYHRAFHGAGGACNNNQARCKAISQRELPVNATPARIAQSEKQESLHSRHSGHHRCGHVRPRSAVPILAPNVWRGMHGVPQSTLRIIDGGQRVPTLLQFAPSARGRQRWSGSLATPGKATPVPQP